VIVDIHCHLFQEYYDDLENVINKMENNIIIVSGTNLETNQETINICNKYDNVYGTIGFHPTELDNFKEEDLSFIIENIDNPKIIGIGEIGLDYYWKNDNKDQQKRIFEKQLKLAKKYNKTVVIHSREALEDTYKILNKDSCNNLKGVLHCYSYDLESAKKFTKMGYMLGIGGIITFKKADLLREVVKNIDLNYLLLETDSPFLTPRPYIKSRNEPINVKLIAKKVAELKNIEIEKVYAITTKNAFCQFDLKKGL